MKEKSIRKNYIFNLVYQVLLLVTPLVTAPHLARVLGADGVGRVSFVESITGYFVLVATMGLATYAQREISYVRDSRAERSRVFWNTVFTQFIIAGCVLAVYLVFSGFQVYPLLYMVFGFQILERFVDVTWFYNGMEEFGRLSLRGCITKLISVIYILVVIQSKEDMILYGLGYAGFAAISGIVMWIGIGKYIDKPVRGEIRLFTNFKVVLALFIPAVATQVYTVLDKTMIGLITKSEFENGYYDEAIKLPRICLMVVTALGTVLIPRIGNYFRKNELDKVKDLMMRSYRFAWMASLPMAFGLAMIAGNFLPWFLGDGFEKSIVLLRILAVLVPLIGLSNVTGLQYMVPVGREKHYTISVITGALVNLVLNFFMIRAFQSIGAAIASVIAELSVTASQFIFVRREFPFGQVLKVSWKYWIGAAVMGGALFGLDKVLTPGAWQTIVMIACGVVVYAAMLIVLKDDFFIGNVKQILKKIKEH